MALVDYSVKHEIRARPCDIISRYKKLKRTNKKYKAEIAALRKKLRLRENKIAQIERAQKVPKPKPYKNGLKLSPAGKVILSQLEDA